MSRIFFIAALLIASSARAQTLPPMPAGARSMEVIDDGVEVRDAPSDTANRRGTIERGTRLQVLERRDGRGCGTRTWARIAGDLWVCADYLRASHLNPWGVPQPVVPYAEILPYGYAFAGPGGATAYARPFDAETGDYVESVGEGFGVAITERSTYAGSAVVRTRRGNWILGESLRYARPSYFAGVRVGEPPRAGEAAITTLDFAWVLRNDARVYVDARGRRVARTAARYEVVRIAPQTGRPRMVALADGTFIAARDIARPTLAPPPREVNAAAGEKWIDVEIASQTLVAYRGATPVFATLVSTGRALPDHATPIGTFRIWVKLAVADMDDLERSDVERNYSIEAVPWVQYFEGSNGLHAAFWHDRFGERRSHGCVNLSPRDARWLFDFTGPTMPVGWSAVLPTASTPGTVVRVR